MGGTAASHAVDHVIALSLASAQAMARPTASSELLPRHAYNGAAGKMKPNREFGA
jgi:hypothetical protein